MSEYYQLDESSTKVANDNNHMNIYQEESATERAEGMANRYSRKLTEYAYYRGEASCPSILTADESNFPVRKREWQVCRHGMLMNQLLFLEEDAEKVKNLLTLEQLICSSDEGAIEALEKMLADLQELQEKMKAANLAIQMMDTEKSGEALEELGFNEEQIRLLHIPDRYGYFGFPEYELSYNAANIHRVRRRLESLRMVKRS